jgi:hypothetical protein
MVEGVIKDLSLDQNSVLIASLSELSKYFKEKY